MMDESADLQRLLIVNILYGGDFILFMFFDSNFFASPPWRKKLHKQYEGVGAEGGGVRKPVIW